MSKFDLKSKVHKLRREGKSIKQILDLVPVSKSTISLWCREIELSETQKESLHKKMVEKGHEGRMKGAEINHLKKLQAQNEARLFALKLFNDFSIRDRLVSGIALYWAEGSKAPSTTGFLFVNSDPIMIHFMFDWLTKILKVQKDDIFLQISINEIHRIRIEEVLRFWSNLVDLPRNQFAKTFFSKTLQKKVYTNLNAHYGVCRLGVRKSSILKYKVLALIDILKSRGSSVG